MNNVSVKAITKNLATSYDYNSNTCYICISGEIDTAALACLKSFYDLYVQDNLQNEKRVNPTIGLISYGGDLFCSFGIIDLMRTYEKQYGIKTDILVLGPCFSASALIAINGTGVRKMTANSYLMVHDISGMTSGYLTATAIESTARSAKELKARYISLLMDKSSLTKEEIESNLRDDIFFTSNMAKEKNMIDEIL